MKDDLLSKLKSSIGELNPSETKVTQYVLANADTTIHLSIAALAQKAKVSEPTVIRFCRSLGFKGYQDFKLQLAVSISKNDLHADIDITPDDNTATIARKICIKTTQCLETLGDSIDIKNIDLAVTHLLSAERIEIYGTGESAIACRAAQHGFLCNKIPATAPKDPATQILSAATLNSSSAALIISSTDQVTSNIEIAKIAKEQGAKIIGIIPKESYLANFCNCALEYIEPDSTSNLSIISQQMSHLTLINILITSLIHKREQRV